MRDRNIHHRLPIPAEDLSHEPTDSIVDRLFRGDLSQIDRLHQTVAAAIRQCRIALDISQDEMAVRLGWQRSTYSYRDSGRTLVTVPDFFLIAYAFNLTVVQLLSRVLVLYSDPSSKLLLGEPPSVADRPGRIRTWHDLRSVNDSTAELKDDAPSLDYLLRATAAVIHRGRRQANLSEDDFAARMRWSPYMASQIERGSHPVYVTESLFVATALNLTPRQFFTQVEEE